MSWRDWECYLDNPSIDLFKTACNNNVEPMEALFIALDNYIRDKEDRNKVDMQKLRNIATLIFVLGSAAVFCIEELDKKEEKYNDEGEGWE